MSAVTIHHSLHGLLKQYTARTLLGLSVFLLSACAITTPAPSVYHNTMMRGQILSLEGNVGVICIGKNDNAAVGQVLEVVRHKPRTAGGMRRAKTFERITVGKVKIASIVDDHYSDVEVISGDVRETDTVELSAR